MWGFHALFSAGVDLTSLLYCEVGEAPYLFSREPRFQWLCSSVADVKLLKATSRSGSQLFEEYNLLPTFRLLAIFPRLSSVEPFSQLDHSI